MIGPRNDPKADFSMFSGSRGWILDPWGGRVNARNEKTRREAGSSEALGGSTPWTSGNRFGGTVLPKHPPSLRHEGARIKQNSLETLLPLAAAFGALACLQGLGSRVVALGVAAVGPNGETLHTAHQAAAHPSTDTRTGRHEKTGQKVPESHQELSDRDGVVSGGGALSERAEGRQRGGNATLVR